jgi:hypothetical protein
MHEVCHYVARELDQIQFHLGHVSVQTPLKVNYFGVADHSATS